MEGIEKQEALEYVLEAMKKSEAFKGIENDDVKKYAELALETDFAYMDENKVSDGGVYDEDEAYDYIMEKLSSDKDDETAAMISMIVDGYLEYFDEYLEKNDLIEWE